jgi:hypothetical protein
MVFSAFGRILGIAPGVAFNSYNDGLFGFLAGPPFSSPQQSLLIVMFSPALKGDEGEPGSNWPLPRHALHDFKNTAPASF